MPEQFDPAYWEARYADRDGHHHVEPNPYLVRHVSGLAPGAALDVGCGEGGSVLWLAASGWRVTGVDVSPTALERARQHGARLGAEVTGRMDLREADLTTWSPPAAQFDLVTAHYVHPGGRADTLVRRLAAAVVRGGVLLVVDHGPGDEHAHTHTPVQALADALDAHDWTVEVAEVRSRGQGHGPHQHGRNLRDSVLVARRHRVAPSNDAAVSR
jgi:SAM-dependent methyltransferase